MKSISPKDWDDPVRGHHQCTAADLVVLGFRGSGFGSSAGVSSN